MQKLPKATHFAQNHFVINNGNQEIFQSDNSIIVVRENNNVTLDEHLWSISHRLTTMSEYRNKFLGESTSEIKRKVDNGTYKLANLNY
jgi:hypothetical protein